MPDQKNSRDEYLSKAVEITIRIGLLILFVYWCVAILTPFITLILWGIIIAVAIYPLFNSLKKRLRGRGTLAAIILTLTMLAVILIPSFLLGESVYEGIRHFKDAYQNGKLIPPPDERVESWPAIAKPIADFWKLAATSLDDAIIKYKPQLTNTAQFLFEKLKDTGLGILQFVVSIIIAGVILVYAQSGGEAITKIFTRLSGHRGKDFASVVEVTIRQVVKGILGVAAIQAGMASLGFFVAGVPAAGLWTLLSLILAIVQIGVGPIVIPVVIYMYSASDPLTASLLLAWSVFVMVSDNVLKPILLGRGAPVPMVIIFLGSIGGFITLGFIGLFLGAVILSLSYKVFQEWLIDDSPPALSDMPTTP